MLQNFKKIGPQNLPYGCRVQKSAIHVSNVNPVVFVHVTGLGKFMLSHVTWGPHEKIIKGQHGFSAL